VSAEAIGTLDPTAGYTGDDVLATQETAQVQKVVALVRPQPVRPPPTRPAPGTDRRNGGDQRDQDLVVIQVRGRDGDDQRQPRAIGQDMDF